MLANIAGTDGLILLVVVLVVLFGGSQLPKLARNMGLAGKEFRKAHEEAMADKPAAPATMPVPPPPAAVPSAAAVPPVAAVPPAPSDQVVLSRADLEALLDEREARAKRNAS